MTPRQKRMWTRRVLRAGWLLAPILAVPGQVVRALFGTPSRAGTTLGCALVVGGISACAMNELHKNSYATPEEIKAALKDNWCMQELMPRRVKLDYKDQPLRVYQLKLGLHDCEEAAERAKVLQQQAAAMETKK